MTYRCVACNVMHDGNHTCKHRTFCGDCSQYYPHSEINGHRCVLPNTMSEMAAAANRSILHTPMFGTERHNSEQIELPLEDDLLAGICLDEMLHEGCEKKHLQQSVKTKIPNTAYDAGPERHKAAILAFEGKEGIKNDQEKPDLSLIPAEFSAETAKAFMWGEKKYGRYNYLNGMDWHRLIAATKRHVDAFQEGEDKDPESGYLHLGHAAASLAMLLVYYKRGLGKDTRSKGSK